MIELEISSPENESILPPAPLSPSSSDPVSSEPPALEPGDSEAPNPEPEDSTPADAPAPLPTQQRPCPYRHQGKIALLPFAVREELNRRIRDGQPVAALLDWLNNLPETRQVIDAHFNGKPLNLQNVNSWRRGPYQKWLQERRVMEQTAQLATTALERSKMAGASLSEVSATLFLGKLMARLEELNLSYIGISEIVDLANAIATLRKGDAQSEASRIARDKLQLARDKFEHDRKPPAPRRSPTKEEIEEIERMLHIM